MTVLKSGVHPTVAGVVLGFMTPATAWVGSAGFPNVLTKILERLVKGAADSSPKQRRRALSQLATTAREGTSPLERLEFFTMSIFIGSLALEGDLLDDGKIGTLAGSAISAILGCALLLIFMPMGSETTGTLPTRETLDDDSNASIGERSC